MLRVIAVSLVLSLALSPIAIADQLNDYRIKEGEKLLLSGKRKRISGIVFTSTGLGITSLGVGLGLWGYACTYNNDPSQSSFDPGVWLAGMSIFGVVLGLPFYIIGGPLWLDGNSDIEQGNQMLKDVKINSSMLPIPSFGYVPGSENPLRLSITWNW